MINYKYADLFNGDSVDKQLIITTDDGTVTITNKEIHSEQFELNESICSDSTLRYGSCEASSLKMRIANVFTSLKGKWLTVKCVLNGHDAEPFVFGRYKVDSGKPAADKRYCDIVAYDAMYDILTADVAEWYNSLTFPMTLRAFRNALILHFGLEEVEISLPNDEMTVERTIEPSEISGKDVITAICEINACFGHIGRSGKFEYVVLKELTKGLYPSNTLYPANDLFPRQENVTRIKSGKYIKATYEDYVVQKIDKVQIRQEKNDIGGSSGSGNNAYIIEDNFLVYGKTTDELNGIAAKFLSAAGVVIYRPSSVNAIGNPCLEVGDPIKVSTKYQNIETYILSRTLKGIQGIKDTYSAKGSEYSGNNVNSVQRSIIQLKAKTNVLIRTVEETRLEMADIEEGLTNTISVTAKELRVELADTKNGLESVISQTAAQIRLEVADIESNLSSSISQTATQIRSEVTDANNGLQSQITQNAKGLSAEIERAEDAEYKLSTKIEANAEGVSAEVRRATEAEGKLQSSYNQLADEIVLKVDANGNLVTVSLSADASTGSSFTLSADNIDLRGKTINLTSDDISIESTNFSVDADGNVRAVNGEFSGTITCGVGSSVGGFETDNNSLFKGSWGSSTPDVFMCTGSIRSYTLGGHTSSGWVFGAGSDFGVLDDGSVYCSNLNASGGTIGGLTIGEVALIAGDAYINYSGNARFKTLNVDEGSVFEGEVRAYEIYITSSQDFYEGWSVTSCLADIYDKLSKINAKVGAY